MIDICVKKNEYICRYLSSRPDWSVAGPYLTNRGPAEMEEIMLGQALMRHLVTSYYL